MRIKTHRSLLMFMCAGILASGGLSPAFAITEADLCQRLSDFDKTAYEMALDDISKTSPSFKASSKTKKEAAELEKNRDNWITQIKSGDKEAFEKASALLAQLDQVLLSNPLLKNKKILAIKRHFPNNSRSVISGGLGLAPSNFQNNSEIGNPAGGWDNEYVQYDIQGTKIDEKLVYKPETKSIISDTEPHWNGEKVMYSSIGANNRWHLFELDLKTGNTSQLTPDEYKDFDSFDGCYSPDGSYIFCSTATFLGLPCTNGGNKMCGLFSYDPKTGKSRQLTFDQDSNWNPVVMNNGLILYQRWEYADLPHSNSRMLFTMNPDGTSQLAFYGSNSYFPTAFFGARPIPGQANKVVGIAGGHHSVTRSGQLLILDPSKSRYEADGVIAEIPYRGKKVVAEVRDRFPDGKWPQFLQPFPLNDKYFLVSMKRSPESLWGVYLVDVFNNMTLIAEQEGAAVLEPVVLEKRSLAPVIPSRVKPESPTGTVFVQDVYYGNGLKGIPRGTVKKLRIGSYGFSPVTQGGLLGSIGLDGPWDIKRVLGEVDVEEDGSAMFTVPVNEPLFIQPLDADGKALQIMRSWLTAMPGENVSCVGCHEDRNMVAETKQTIASRKAPQTIQPFYEKERGFSFVREVQPVLDRACVGCHDGSKPEIPYLKGDKMLTDWSSGISGHGSPAYAGKFSEAYYQLQRYVRRPGIESDMNMLVPMDVHADQTELFQVLNKGHHGVKLTDEERRKLACWVDMNAPYHGRRSDIPHFDQAKGYCDLKEKYNPMFGVAPRDLEWMPEVKQGIVAEIPEQPAVDNTPAPEVKGWPFGGEGRQIGFNYYRKTVDLGNGVEMKLIKVPAGEFVMGSNRQTDEAPMTAQKIEKPFWIGQFEITNAQFAAFNKDHDSRTEHRHGYQFGQKGYPLNKPDQPAVRISWQEANEFCQWLSDKTGMKVSLPTEAQWEWACRAGRNTAYSFGDLGADYSKYANMGDKRLKEFAACTAHKFYESAYVLDNASRYDDWIPRDDKFDDGGFVSESVGRYRENAWELFDMHGNVWEWTRSAYKPYPYNEADGRNDVSAKGVKRVARGGSWYDRPFKGTSSYRLPYADYQKAVNVGFRIIIEE